MIPYLIPKLYAYLVIPLGQTNTHTFILIQDITILNLSILILCIICFSSFIFFGLYQKKLKKELNHIRKAHQEKTLENKDLIDQQDKLEKQKKIILSSNSALNQAIEKMTFSLGAAERIQEAIIPTDAQLAESVLEAFAIYLPKDIVSGDLYWAGNTHAARYIVMLDCIGHGVSGAFISLIANTLLDRIILIDQVVRPSEIIIRLEKELLLIFGDQSDQLVGMDAVVMAMEKNNRQNGKVKLHFAGAKRYLLFWEKAKQDYRSIRGYRKQIGRIGKAPVPDYELELERGTMIYFGSDGIEDQQNLNNKKLGFEGLVSWLQEIHNLNTNQQKRILLQKLNQYKQGCSQRDDMVLLGIRL